MPRRPYTEIIRQRTTASSESQTARINELIRTARTSWFGLLSYLAFVGVTLLGVQDADFFIVERETALPLIGVSIPTLQLFWVAPTLGAALYAYFHLHLLKLYDALDAAEPTAVPLSDRTSPWLVVDFALFWKPGALSHRPMRWLALSTTLLLAYLAAPIVLFGFWFRSMPYHHEGLTLLGCGLPFMISLYTGRKSWSHMIARLRPGGAAGPLIRTLIASLGVVVSLTILAVGWMMTEGSFERTVRYLGWFNDDLYKYDTASPGANPAHAQWWGNPELDRFLYSADLANVDFVNTPEAWREHDTARQAFRIAWCDTQGIPASACGPADPWAALEPEEAAFLETARHVYCSDQLGAETDKLHSRCATRFAELDDSFNEEWREEWRVHLLYLTSRNLRGRDLRRANLFAAQLQGANLSEAQLQGAFLSGAQLQEANLFEAQLQGAFLFEAQLQEANLSRAQLQGAFLFEAQLQGADLSRAQLQGATLIGAQLQGARLSRAQLQGARLSRAQLQGADLFEAQLQGADLFEAQLQGADLFEAQLSEDTNLTAATLRGAAVRFVDDTTLSQFQAHGDWDQIFRQESFINFNDAWRAFAAALDPPVTIAPDYNRTD